MTDTEPIRVSWSRIRVAEECLQKSYLQRSGKKHGSRDVRIFFRGTVVDRVMRNWLLDPVPGAMPGMVRSTLDYEEELTIEEEGGVVRWKHKQDREDTVRWCTRLVEELEPILNEIALPYTYFASQTDLKFEVPVSIPLDGEDTTIILNGEMDLLVNNQDKYVCWDLKGTENNDYWKKVVGQLVFYDIVTAAKYGTYCEYTGLIQPLADPKIMTFQFTTQDYQNMWQRIIRYAENVKNDVRTMTENTSHCAYCDEKHACPRFKTTVDDNGKRKALGLVSKQAGST